MNNKQRRIDKLGILIMAVCTLVSGCGGGGGGGDPLPPSASLPPPQPPPEQAPVPAPEPLPPPIPEPPPADPTAPPAPLLKPTSYAVLHRYDGQPLNDGGTWYGLVTADGMLSLGVRGGTTLSVTSTSPFVMTAENTDFRVFSRYEGSLLMLCDPAEIPGSSPSRFALAADAVADGGVSGAYVIDQSELKGRTFYRVENCSYASATGIQHQDVAPDSTTHMLVFDDKGDGYLAGSHADWPYFDSSALQIMMNGAQYNWREADVIKFRVGDIDRYVIVERRPYDEVDRVEGPLILWLDD